MAKINGVNATETDAFLREAKKERTPTINQILDNMQNNFDKANNQTASIASTQEPKQSNNLLVNLISLLTQKSDKNNLLMSILPIILNASNKNADKKETNQSELLQQLTDNYQNPNITQVIELIQSLQSNKKKEEKKESQNSTQNNKKLIDSYTKTSDYEH